MTQIHYILKKETSHIAKTSVGCQMINVLGLCLNPHMEDCHINIIIIIINRKTLLSFANS
jgi:hypothetical protein